jgi:hypothetical protein
VSRGETTPGLDAGDKAEVRVAQVWFWDGYYVRRGVDLQKHFSREALSVTDLDLLGYSISPALTWRKQIGEVKSGKSSATPRPLDRALWARGLRELVQAEAAEITTAFQASSDLREFTRTFGVTIQHFSDLEAREQRLNIVDLDEHGSQGESIAVAVKSAHAQFKKDAELERAFWFLRSEVWFLDPVDAIKRNLGLLRQLKTRWSEQLNHDELHALRWAYAESISILGLHLTLVAGTAVTMSPNPFNELMTAKLATGDVSLRAMEKLADKVDEYVISLLKKTDASLELRTSALGAFRPTEPEYAEPLIELIQRISSQTAATSRLPRQLDMLIFERLVRGRNPRVEVVRRLGYGPASERFIRTIAAFLRGRIGLPDAVDTALTTPIPVPNASQSHDQPALFSESEINKAADDISQ